MGFDLDIFEEAAGGGLEVDYLEWLVDERWVDIQTHFAKLWEYYTNPTYEVGGTSGANRKVNESGRCYLQGQEYGLPVRITGLVHSANAGVLGARCVRDVQRKEVVIENDIAGRIHAAVDFLFGKPVTFVSKSPKKPKRAEIETILKAVFEANGGIGFFQDMAVLGGVYGFVDCLVRPGDEILEQFISSGPHFAKEKQNGNLSSSKSLSIEDVLQLVQTIELELIEAPRALPVLEENDYKKIGYYVQHFWQKRNAASRKNSFLSRLL
jgi:hypothetical protein